MAQSRRPRARDRGEAPALLDAAERDHAEGRLRRGDIAPGGAEAGIKLHYHFGTIDDLFVAVVRRHGESSVARLADALASPEPLQAWWRLVSDRRGNALLVELTAAANHRPALQAETALFAREVRRMQIEALDAVLDEYGIDREHVPAGARGVGRAGHGFRDGPRPGRRASTPPRRRRRRLWRGCSIGWRRACLTGNLDADPGMS